MQKYGTFCEDGTEFIITRPDTPAPWVNYISNGRYSGLISHTGGGYSFYMSPRDSRITRWRYNSLPWDRPGRYLYLRDQKNGEYWSPTWQPTETPLENYQCCHGLYYTRISSRYKNISAGITYFVPSDDLEVWKIRLKNEGNEKRWMDIFAYVELCLGHALVDLINQPNDQHFNQVYFHPDAHLLFATKRYWVKFNTATVKQANESWDKYVFFGSSLPVKGWDGSKDLFIGRWRSEANPLAVEEGRCRNLEIAAGDAAGALQVEVTLEPGEEKEFSVFLGVVPIEDYLKTSIKLAEKYRQQNNVEMELRQLKEEWKDYLSAVNIETPDPDMNIMLNVWNQYQTSVTFRFSRDASYYHGGLLFGRGYRDSCQDLLGPVIPRPDWARNRILEMCKYQFRDGSTFHLYYPLTGGGEKTGHSDTPLWLPLAVISYLKETGERAILEHTVTYYDEGNGTVLEHIYRAIDYTLNNLTDRKLAKFGPGDWNDTLDYLGREGRGESIWVSMFLAFILKETIGLCNFIGDESGRKRYQRAYETVKFAINELCWDGEWYIRGTNDRGDIIGSRKNEQGKIFLNTQTWAVISGVANKSRAFQCMDAVKKYLETPKGPKILHPPYTRIDPNIGLATRCVAGKKENGAIFNHTVSWAVLAECLLGRGDRAFEIYRKAFPMNPVVDIDRYKVEPYVYAEYVTSPDHPTFGQASHSWLTGSSTWMLRDGIDYILGVRPEYKGLIIDPCIPHDWKNFRIRRKFRGRYYQINVENPSGVNRGIRKLEIEGKEISGNVIDPENPLIQKIIKGKEIVIIKVILG
ncbi:MAG: glycosyl transferase family 36 [Calditrichaeota bacterium]|nr:glycosyl transferase family 36 [Calditrichota bacterium]RQW07286.1 MAG: glycosyl transferase family 36 [Calditrichota bacterium]